MVAATATKPPAKSGDKAPVMRRPFVAGTRRVDKSTYDESKTLGSTTQSLRTFEVEPNGFLGGIYLLSECAGNTATATAAVGFEAEAPFNAYETIQFNDTNNRPILGPWTGYDLKTAVKFGGYSFSDDARESPVYTAQTGTAAGAGSWTFVLRIPVELVHRDALGALPNKSSSATYDLTMRVNDVASIYTGPAETASIVLRTRLVQFGWMDPNAADMKGNPVAQNPPGVQTTQYWAKQDYTTGSGNFNTRLTGLDSMIRNLVFVLYDDDARGSQSDSDFPDPFNLVYETSQPINRLKTVWRHMIGEGFGYKNAVETAGGRDYGVYPEPYCQDFGPKVGWETRLGYLPVSAATTLTVNGTFGGSGTKKLVVLVNKVVPANGDPLTLTGR